MAKSSTSAFDDIIQTFGTDEDRDTFRQLAERNPEIQKYGLRQSDYSRLMDENRDKLKRLDQWQEWRDTHWVPDESDPTKGWTKEELAQKKVADQLAKEKADLEQQILNGLGSEEVDFAQLETWGNKWMQEKGLVTNDKFTDQISKKEGELRSYVNDNAKFTAKFAVTVPWLNQQHEKEFGETFNPNDFIREALEKQQYEPEEYYNKYFVVEKRQAAQKAKFESEIKRVNEEKEKAVNDAKQEAANRESKLAGMGQNGQAPTDGDGPNMGDFQRQYYKMDKAEETDKAPEVDVGEYGLSKFAARKFREAQTAGRS